MPDPLDIINRLANAEQEQKRADFLVPILKGSRLRLRICGIVQEYSLTHASQAFEGWGIVRLVRNKAQVIRPATPAEQKRAADLLPRASFVLLDQVDGVWQGLQLGVGTRGLRTDGLIPIRMVLNPKQFGAIQAVCDGQNFWYSGTDTSRPARVGQYLRDALVQMSKPVELRFPGLLASERSAYEYLWMLLRPKSAYDPKSGMSERERIETALKLAGVDLNKMSVLNQHAMNVFFEANGKEQKVTIRRDTLQVISSGICLSGRDSDFDLTSIVGVLKEKGANQNWADEEEDDF